MTMESTASTGMQSLLQEDVKKSHWPARLDKAQSLSGAALGFFMWTHLVLVSSILISKDAMMKLSRFMELGFLKPGERHAYPIAVSAVAFGVFTLFVAHAGLAMRKFPATWKQHRIFRSHMDMMQHSDTRAWYTQVLTGFIMFFLGSVHLYVMMSRPDNIGPYESADRVWSYHFWPLYFVLLFAVELHGAIGMYRVAVKWGLFNGNDVRKTRRNLKVAKSLITVFFLTLGLASLAAYIKIGMEHAGRVGEPYEAVGESTAQP